MIKIQVTSAPIDEKTGVSPKSGKPYRIRTQKGYAFVVDKNGVIAEIPEKFDIQLEDAAVPYAPGFYTLQPSSLRVVGGPFGSTLEVDRPRLVPVASTPRNA